jgi:hypothetical protein
MRKVFILLLALIISAASFAQTKTENNKTKLAVYYFHAANRCPTCISIENNTQKTLDTYFKKELENGTIKFIVLNSDDDANKAVCQKYEAFGSALHLVKISNGKEKDNDFTNFAFSYSRNEPEKFMNGLKDKINQLLK